MINKKVMRKAGEKNPLNTQAVMALIERVAGSGARNRFIVEGLGESPSGKDRFVLDDYKGKIRIRANTGSAAAAGLRYYLHKVLRRQKSMLPDNLYDEVPPEEYIPVGQTVIRESPFIYRYFLNYCTYGYTFAFWKWEEFERLLDFLSLSGCNLVLNILAHEAVVAETLKRIGYPPERIKDYFSGPAFLPWQWMQNISGYRGPLPEGWFENRLRLSRDFNRRASELGIKVVMPGFGGMVPNDFRKVFPEANILEQGDWCGLARPPILSPKDPLFSKMADIFYQVTGELFGPEIGYFSVDPFHEGGNSFGVDMADMARAIFMPMKSFNSEAVWVMQGWQNNPDRRLLDAVPNENLLILDLLAETRENDPSFDYFNGVPWIYCTVNNYGAQRQLRGNLKRSLQLPFESLMTEKYGVCVGYGLMMEGITCDDVLFDIYGEIAFSTCSPNVEDYLKDYVLCRYGIDNQDVLQAWKLLADQVYIISDPSGIRESIFCSRPGLYLTKGSYYGSDFVLYSTGTLINIAKTLFQAHQRLKDNHAYRFDMTDICRQMLSHCGWDVYNLLIKAYEAGDMEEMLQLQQLFLELMSLADRLCGCVEEMRLDSWLEKARSLGKDLNAEELMEQNARLIITTWGNGDSFLYDYAQKEWHGLLSGLYSRRWESFFEAMTESLETGNPLIPIDFYKMEDEFVRDRCWYDADEKEEDWCGLVAKSLYIAEKIMLYH